MPAFEQTATRYAAMSRRRRSCLSVPGSSQKMVDKAPSLGADEVVFDLEDAVRPERKDAARALVLSALAPPWGGDGIAAVRVNAVGTRWCHEDIIGTAAARGVTSIVVPKVECAGDVAFVDRLLAGAEAVAGRREPVGIQALIETPRGLSNLPEIAGHPSPRLESLVVGYADLAATLGRSASAAADVEAWHAIREAVLVAARTNGLLAIDGPYLGVDADAPMRTWSARVAAEGFDGKWAIHPRQVAVLNEAFTPTTVEVQRARAIIDALDRGAQDGLGAVARDGQMLDEALRASADRTLGRVAPPAGRPAAPS